MTLTPHPLLVPWSWKSRAIPLLPLWAVQPVQSLSSCTRVHFTFYQIEDLESFLRACPQIHTGGNNVAKPHRGWYNIGGTANRLRAERSGVRISAEPRYFCLLLNVQIGCGVQPSSHSNGHGFFPVGKAAGTRS